MTPDAASRLEQVADLAYLREYRRVKAVLDAERKTAAELARLDAMRPQRGDRRMSAVGADLAWQAWVDGRRRELSIELAALRARKLMVIDRVTHALGRLEASRDLHRQSRNASLRARTARQMEALLSGSMGAYFAEHGR